MVVAIAGAGVKRAKVLSKANSKPFQGGLLGVGGAKVIVMRSAENCGPEMLLTCMLTCPVAEKEMAGWVGG